MSTKTLRIDGMSCQHCVHAVTTVLQSVPGVRKAEVSLEKKTAVLDVGEEFSEETAANAVKEEGYTVVGSA